VDGCRLAARSDVHSLLAVLMCKRNRRTTADAGKHRFGEFSHQLEILPLQNADISNWLKDYTLIGDCLSKKAVVLKQPFKQHLRKCFCSFCINISRCWTRLTELTC